MRLPSVLGEIHRELKDAGATRITVVGGSVRDHLLGVPVSDFDSEVFGLGHDDVLAVLGRFGKPELVGESFGVIKLRVDGEDFDFSLPRTERKSGDGHKAFDVTVDLDMDVVTAASRRDFTMNSMAFDGELIDPFGGRADLEAGILRHTSDAFAEDPLRVLRGMQFAGRFDLVAAEETLGVARALKGDIINIAAERVFVEFEKLMRSRVPSKGLRFLLDSGCVECFPELDAMVRTPQDARHHPEGSVFAHTMIVMDRMAAILDVEGIEDRSVLMFAALLHDVGKPSTTVVAEDGSVSSKGHARAGEVIARSFLSRMRAPKDLTDRVVKLVGEHMSSRTDLSEKAIQRLARRLAPVTIREFLMVKGADRGGESVDVGKFLAIAESLKVADAPPEPILMGRHLLALMNPGPGMGRVLREVFEMQIDGRVQTLDECLEEAMRIICEC